MKKLLPALCALIASSAHAEDNRSIIDRSVDVLISQNGGCSVAAEAINPAKFDWRKAPPFEIPIEAWTEEDGKHLADRYLDCYFKYEKTGIEYNYKKRTYSKVLSSIREAQENKKYEQRKLESAQKASIELDFYESEDRVTAEKVNKLLEKQKNSTTFEPELKKQIKEALIERSDFLQKQATYYSRFRDAEFAKRQSENSKKIAAVNAALAPYREEEKIVEDQLKAITQLETAKRTLEWCSSKDVQITDRQTYETFAPMLAKVQEKYLKVFSNLNEEQISSIIAKSDSDASKQKTFYDDMVRKSAEANYLLYGTRQHITAKDFPQFGILCRSAELQIQSLFDGKWN